MPRGNTSQPPANLTKEELLAEYVDLAVKTVAELRNTPTRVPGFEIKIGSSDRQHSDQCHPIQNELTQRRNDAPNEALTLFRTSRHDSWRLFLSLRYNCTLIYIQMFKCNTGSLCYTKICFISK